jgi:Peptidase family M20/M25/M40
MQAASSSRENQMGKLWMGWTAAAMAVIAMAMPVAAQSDLDQKIDSNIADWVGTYQHLHANPELSTQEKATSELIAGALRKLGYDVTDHFGKYEEADLVSYGVVAVLKNGPGPTVYVRTELDALPVRENTGLSYASKVTVKRANDEVGVMHACGHDLHMTVFLGTAKMLAEEKSHWSGTVVMIAQPAEEMVSGAAAMLRAGLFEKFPKPDYVGAARLCNATGGGRGLAGRTDPGGSRFGGHHDSRVRGTRCEARCNQGSDCDCIGTGCVSADDREPGRGSTAADGDYSGIVPCGDQTQHHSGRSASAIDGADDDAGAAGENACGDHAGGERNRGGGRSASRPRPDHCGVRGYRASNDK